MAGNNTSSPDPVTTPTPRDTHYTPSTTTTTITPPITINTIPTGTTPPQPTTAPAPTLPTTPKLLDRVSNMDDFQNDYIEDRPPPPSSSSSSSSTHLRYDHPFPEVIVPAGVPVYHEPRVPYGHHSRGLSPGGNFNKVPSPPAVSVGTVTVRVEEICLVLVVLMLWAGAITLFINRWGKLRMLEPYQPAYTAPEVPPRPPPPPLGPFINIQSTSDLTLTDGGAAGGRHDWGAPESYGRGSLASGYLGMERSPSCLSVRTLNPQRKVKSAVDLVSLVMQEKMSSNIHLAATNV
ncbi:proline-rich receptor-like protein kinase PERK1 [Homarus americanus]|uniref:proline-rich receptor-like protein kinase PERK1 n=1 Tax=Homarus americanus TaxID=6706 RepID=UPI001C47DC44|nr:proline-rich receptor-like protein kinase PERK1 [Homarus americanus]XP_042218256.1 proline-rich receptor-like protein kinase PERK1 [Homarus americanus]